MNEIDHLKLAAIFRTLSSKKLSKNNDSKTHVNKSDSSSHSLKIHKSNNRSKHDLKKNIKQRLSTLKKSDKDFDNKAKIVTIQEILFWEFGAEIINHPDFNHLSISIMSQIALHSELASYLYKFINDPE